MPSIRPVPYQKLVCVFEKDGWTFSRQSGDHLIYTKADAVTTTTSLFHIGLNDHSPRALHERGGEVGRSCGVARRRLAGYVRS